MLLLTPVFEPDFNVLSDGTNHFAPYGSLNNHHLIGGSTTESQSEHCCVMRYYGKQPIRVHRGCHGEIGTELLY